MNVATNLQSELTDMFSEAALVDGFAGIGVDLASVARIKLAIERSGEAFVERVYLPDEIAYCRAAEHSLERFAALWAVREAAVKALGTGYADGVGFHDIEILCREGAAPRLRFHGRFAQIAASRNIHDSRVTLSHDRDHVVAVVVLFNKIISASLAEVESNRSR